MPVIKLRSVAAVVDGFVIGIAMFSDHCTAKFGHAFVTKKAFCITAAALDMLIVGNMWRHSVIENHGDALNGVVLMILGVSLACWLV